MITFESTNIDFYSVQHRTELVYGTYYLVSELLVFVVLLMLVYFLYGCIVALSLVPNLNLASLGCQNKWTTFENVVNFIASFQLCR